VSDTRRGMACPRCETRVSLAQSFGLMSLNPLRYRCQGCGGLLTIGVGAAAALVLAAILVGMILTALIGFERFGLLAVACGAAGLVLHVLMWRFLPLSLRDDSPPWSRDAADGGEPGAG